MSNPKTLKWLIAPQPQLGELFESWLIHACNANSVSALSVIQHYALEHIVGTLDAITADDLIHLATDFRIEIHALLQTHLGHFLTQSSDKVLEAYTIYTQTKGQNAAYYKVCPHCLRQQSKPHLLLEWALNWTFFCPTHQQPLLDTCPRCNRQFRLNSVESDRMPDVCWKCGYRLSQFRHLYEGDFSRPIALQTQLRHLGKSDQVRLPSCLPITGLRLVQIIKKLIWKFEAISLSGTFLKSCTVDFSLVDDLFSLELRRLNSFLLIAWMLEVPMKRIPVLQQHIRANVGNTNAVIINQTLQNTLETLQIRGIA
jgi:TniQ